MSNEYHDEVTKHYVSGREAYKAEVRDTAREILDEAKRCGVFASPYTGSEVSRVQEALDRAVGGAVYLHLIYDVQRREVLAFSPSLPESIRSVRDAAAEAYACDLRCEVDRQLEAYTRQEEDGDWDDDE